MEHSINIKVVGIYSASQYLFCDVRSLDPGSNLPFCLFFRKFPPSEDFSSQSYSFNYLYISCTAADIVSDCMADFLFCRVRNFIQKTLCAYYHAWNAESALDSSSLAEGIVVDLLLPVAQSFHCGYRVA